MNIVYSQVFLFLLQFLFVFDRALELPKAYPLPKINNAQKCNSSESSKIMFKSADGGKTWQDISQGLPEPAGDNYVRNNFFADEDGVYLAVGNLVYHYKPNFSVLYWSKANFPDAYSNISPGKAGLYAYSYGGGILQKINGTSTWSPVYANFQQKMVRTVFETSGGIVFIGTDNGLFKSKDLGKTWKQVHTGGWVGKLIESGEVLVATSMKGIIRSTDGGDNWSLAINEGGVGIDVAHIKDGFAAITFNTRSNTRRIRTSHDGGKTWQPIDTGFSGQNIAGFLQPLTANAPQSTDSVWHPNPTVLPAQAYISSIIQVGENFFCGHPDGIYQSTDGGKTWTLLLPSTSGKIFNLTVSGNVIYALAQEGGC